MRSFGVFPSGILRRINESDVDIVHLHWVNCEMLSLPQIPRIRKAVVWTFHDMWPLCGGQHYADESTFSRLFAQPLHKKQALSSEEPCRGAQNMPFLADALLFRYKNWSWRNLHATVICPSTWLADCARRSRLHCFNHPTVIPNGLDLELFTPREKAACRHEMKLPAEGNVILFGAHNPDDPIKGLHLLHRAIASAGPWPNTYIAAFGARKGPEIGGLPTKWLGAVNDERILATLYSAADVLAFPSLRENLPNTIAEALSCGLPTVAFAVGGIPDLLEHDRNGFLVAPYETGEFGAAIKRMLTSEMSDRMSRQAREKAVAMLDVRNCARRHIDIYEKATRLNAEKA